MRKEIEHELLNGIYPFWHAMLGDDGNFPGRVAIDGTADYDAPKSAVMVMRMLWSFSAIALRYPECGAGRDADLMFEYVKKHFIDREFGGVWWSVDAEGNPLETKKQSYAIGFAIYAMAQYSLLRPESDASFIAMELFNTLESHAYDSAHGGYVEALQRGWSPIEDMRLSEKDKNCVFTMNTHLHILEPYTLLYISTRDNAVKAAVARLLDIFRNRIYRPESGHLGLFFDESWRLSDDEMSYGHDIEASWLICEAVDAIGASHDYVQMADELVRGCEESYLPDGSMVYKKDVDGVDAERHWWVQAEAVVGLTRMSERTGDKHWLERAQRVWDYISDEIIDHERGEWYWSRMADGSVNRKDDKAGFWKCPYHNSRMCLEVLK